MTGRVLGIDPSLTATAVASSAGWVEICGRAGKRTDGYPERLDRLADVLHDAKVIISGGSMIELAVIEGPAYSRSDPSMFDRAWLWWQLYRHMLSCGIPIAVVTPNQAKQYATGKGNAAKGAVIDAVARRWPAYATAGDDNACDAVALLAMGLDYLGRPLAVMPAAHRQVLAKVTWPAIPFPVSSTSPTGARA